MMSMVDILLKENADLQAGYDAARLEIASLRAQLEAVGTGGWMRNGALLYRLTDERRPANFDEIRVTMANGSRDIGQTSSRAERLLVMLSAPQPAAQALDSVRVFWQQHTQADALSMTMAELHTDVELVIRAARGAAQAAPVDAAKLPSPANVGTAPKRLNLNDQAMWVLGWNECLDAARAAQKDTND